MLVTIIEDKNNNVWSQLFLNKDNKDLSLDGFSVSNGVLSMFKREYLDVFNYFLLSESCEKVEDIDGYEVFYDKISKFFHFFKDGKEDFNKFFVYNSVPATSCLGSDSKNSLLRKIFIGVVGISLVIDLSFGVYVLEGSHKKDVVEPASISTDVNTIKTTIFDDISYKFGYLENLLKIHDVALNIRNLIYSSENLVLAEKDFLWNMELINMVASYYVNTNFESVSLSRHTHLKIESFLGEEDNFMNGYYQGDNVLHLRDYNVKNIIEGTDQCRDLAHEYNHLLQVSSCPIFIRESSAEVMSHEFYLKSSDFSHFYAYPEACKYLKILMEIVGPDVIKESNFKLYSNSLFDSVKDYFSDEEYREFSDIMNLSPFWNAEQLRNGKYDRLEELLRILYINKFGTPMEEDVMISAILWGSGYNRPYFSESLKNNSNSYYLSRDYVYVDEVNLENVTDFIYEKQCTREEFSKEKYGSDENVVHFINVVPLVELQEMNIILMGLDARGTITLKDGTVLNAFDAQSKGLIKVEYYSRRIVSEQEFLENYKTDKNYKCKVKIYVPSIDEKLSLYNSDENVTLK